MLRIIITLLILTLVLLLINLLPKKYTVSYNGQDFTPQTLIVRSGDTITFKNDSSTEMEIALGRHEDHAEVEGFEERIIQPQMEYQFSLKQKGVFDFHDHLNPKKLGLLTVK